MAGLSSPTSCKSRACGGYLIIFDRRKRPWKDKIFQREETLNGRVIRVWGM